MNPSAKNSLSAEAMALFGADPNVIHGSEAVAGGVRFRYALIPMFTSPGSRPLPAVITPGPAAGFFPNRTQSAK